MRADDIAYCCQHTEKFFNTVVSKLIPKLIDELSVDLVSFALNATE